MLTNKKQAFSGFNTRIIFAEGTSYLSIVLLQTPLIPSESQLAVKGKIRHGASRNYRDPPHEK